MTDLKLFASEQATDGGLDCAEPSFYNNGNKRRKHETESWISTYWTGLFSLFGLGFHLSLIYFTNLFKLEKFLNSIQISRDICHISAKQEEALKKRVEHISQHLTF